MNLKLKQGMKLGVASAATQIEGGDCGHNWNAWFEKGKISDGSNPARANDHYNLWLDDANLMSEMGIKIYRLGLEWARIFPEEAVIDESVLSHYHQELTYLKEKGISVLLTIHHFTNPMWFEKKGGFSKKENLKYYISFVELVVNSFGDLVNEYITINEPNVYATNSFYFGSWPPGEKSMTKTIAVMSNMAYCHIEAFKLIHNMREEMGYTDTKVGFANHLRVFDPKNNTNPWHCICSSLLERFFQGALNYAMYLGEFKFPLKAPFKMKKGEYSDYIAVNYYTRSTVSEFNDGVLENSPKNDLGWEIYPEGIVRCCEKAYSILKRPVYITENGTCDNEDAFRCRYIFEHLKALCESALPVERYYHWCFCDNFEWVEGESARFGLVHIDYETQIRTIKNSGEFYSEIIKNNGVTDEIFDKYVKNQNYHN